MTNLYSYKGQEPRELPEKIRLSNGQIKTDPSSYTTEELLDIGVTGPYIKPEYNPKIETQSWDYESKKWITTPIAKFYSYKGQEPQELPERIRLSDGRTRTDFSTFTTEELLDAGFTGPYERPKFDSEIETQSWDYESKKWITTPIPDEVFWDRLRNQRDKRLSMSDHTQLSDTPLTNSQKTDWTTYRQALRDLPENTEDPKNVTWPSQPE